jgi:hypothetical protein
LRLLRADYGHKGEAFRRCSEYLRLYVLLHPLEATHPRVTARPLAMSPVRAPSSERHRLAAPGVQTGLLPVRGFRVVLKDVLDLSTI